MQLVDIERATVCFPDLITKTMEGDEIVITKSGLIDTNTFLWFISGDSRLSHTAKTLILEIDNEILLSIASLWEIAIKMSIGKLELSMSYEDLLSAQIEDNEIKLLPIEKNHLKELVRLPFYNRDPFDRLII